MLDGCARSPNAVITRRVSLSLHLSREINQLNNGTSKKAAPNSIPSMICCKIPTSDGPQNESKQRKPSPNIMYIRTPRPTHRVARRRGLRAVNASSMNVDIAAVILLCCSSVQYACAIIHAATRESFFRTTDALLNALKIGSRSSIDTLESASTFSACRPSGLSVRREPIAFTISVFSTVTKLLRLSNCHITITAHLINKTKSLSDWASFTGFSVPAQCPTSDSPTVTLQ